MSLWLLVPQGSASAFAVLVIIPEGNLRLPSSSISAPSPDTRHPFSRFHLPVLLAILAAFLFFLRHRIHFDWSLFLTQLHLVYLPPILAATALILSTNLIRSLRWTIFLRPVQRVPPFSLTGAQFLGFTAVALFGRLADLTRPYLVSRRTGLSLASQVAVYTIERLFDLAAVAILFSTMLFLTPRTAPHHALFVRAGIASLAGTAFLALFALAIRHSGARLATLVQPLSHRLAKKILAFRAGLDAFASLRDLATALALSLLMWLMIAESYVQTTHAFPHTPALATLTFSAVMPLMAASMGGSLLQLPILGWFTQVALTATAMHTLYGAPPEAATACAAVLLLVNTLSVVPVGLFLAQTERLNLRTVAQDAHSPQQPSDSALS